MPAYNEAAALPGTIAECEAAIAKLGLDAEIVVCDDGSTDRTAAVLAELAAGHPRLVVATHARNAGYGAALATAAGAARGRLLVTMDSDGQFDPLDAGALLARLHDTAQPCDVVLGYRARKVDSFLRVWLDRGLRVFVRLLFGLSFTDTNCAIRIVPAEALRRISLEARGFANPTEIAVKLRASGLSIAEIPVTHRGRTAGASALRSTSASLEILAFLFYLRYKLALHRRGVIQRL